MALSFLAWLLAASSFAAGPSSEESVDAVSAARQPELTKPAPLGPVAIPYPSDATILPTPVEVTVRLTVDAEGAVTRVELLKGAGAPFDQAVLVGATHFRFRPASYEGTPTAVQVDFTQRFAPPDVATPPLAQLRGILLEKGTHTQIANARVQVGAYLLRSDSVGHFAVLLPPGAYEVEVEAAGYKPFRVREDLAAAAPVEVRYLLERVSYAPYETVVVSKRELSEPAPTSLRGRELTEIPGTFGDPFRVVSTLPGVAQAFSLLNYPIVRGTSPGNTAFLLDGTRVPQLFHLLAGPAVVHPELIDEVDFYPGGFGARYGGYTGGIVDGHTRRARPSEHRVELDADLTKAGLFVRAPVPYLGASATIAGRYGYPGLLLGLVSPDLSLSYWDYQARLDGGASSHWTAFAFGSFDQLQQTHVQAIDVLGSQQVTEETHTSRIQFHRFDLRYQSELGGWPATAQLSLGVDQVLLPPEQAGAPRGTLTTWSLMPRLLLGHRLADSLAIEAGIEGTRRLLRFGGSFGDQLPTGVDDEVLLGGVFTETPWAVSEDLLLVPGVRADVYHNETAQRLSVDPRFTWRYRLQRSTAGDTWLKGSAGIYHQPPRFIVPLPGFDEVGLEKGLLRSWQVSLGSELPVGAGFELDANAYYQRLDPIFFDLTTNPTRIGTLDAGGNGEENLLLARRVGRSLGLELLVRKQQHGALFGWLSYTLSRSERRYAGHFIPYDFDRTHMLHVVLGYRLPRNWQFGVSTQLHSGRPKTTRRGYNAGRTAPFFRADVRIDKRAVWNDWLLDLYIDIVNVTLSAEQLDNESDSGVRYVIPTVGLRAVL